METLKKANSRWDYNDLKVVRLSQSWCAKPSPKKQVDSLYTWRRKQGRGAQETHRRVEISVTVFIIRPISVSTGSAAVSTPWYVYANLMKEVETRKDEMKATSEKSN